MTGYAIKAGYSGGGKLDWAWKVILEAVKNISHEELMGEYQGPPECEKGCCTAVGMAVYMTTKQGQDASVIIKDDCVYMLASGGDIQRVMKESLRRAFIRCVMRRADVFGVDVDVSTD